MWGGNNIKKLIFPVDKTCFCGILYSVVYIRLLIGVSMTMTLTRRFDPARLKLARKVKGFTGAQIVAELKNRGHRITPMTLHNWEKGVGAPSPDALNILAGLFGCELDDFYYTPQNGEKDKACSLE